MACGSKGFSSPVAGSIVQGPYTGPGTSHFGQNAVDISAADGSPVAAAVPGRIIVAIGGRPDVPSLTDYEGAGPFGRGRYGNFVVELGDDGCPYLYAHMRDVVVSVGQHVDRETLLGHVGQSGHATGPHVHFQVISTQRIDALMAQGGAAPKQPHPSLWKEALGASTAGLGIPLPGLGLPNPLSALNPFKNVGDVLGRFFTFDLANYFKIAGGALVMVTGLLVMLAAVGFSSGAVGGAAEQIPIAGPAIGVARKRSGERSRARVVEARETQRNELAESRASQRAESAYRSAVARRRGKEGLSRSGETYED